MLYKTNNLFDSLNRLARAASEALVAMQRIPLALEPFISHPDPTVASLTLSVGEDLEEIQFYFIPNFDLKPIILKGAYHPHWLVRYTEASYLPSEGIPLRLYAHLLSDPIPAVVAVTASQLLHLLKERVLRLIQALPPSNQSLIYAWFKQVSSSNYLPEGWLAQEIYANLRSLIATKEVRIPSFPLKQTKSAYLPAETIALALEFNKPKISIIDAIIRSHKDPIAIIVTLENALDFYDMPSSRSRYLSILTYAARSDHPVVQLMAVRKLQWEAAPENYTSLGSLLLELTYHPCLLIVQAAARALKEFCDTPTPPRELIDRLLELVCHEDPLVRVNALYALQDYYTSPKSVHLYLLERWKDEPIDRVKAAIAVTLWCWMRPEEWLTTIGLWLWNSEQKPMRLAAKYLMSLWEVNKIQEVLSVVRVSSLSRFLKSLLQRKKARRVLTTL